MSLCAAAVAAWGCAPSERLSSSPSLVETSQQVRRFDLDADGRAEFSLVADRGGDFDVLSYDDDEDGQEDRRYRLSDYDNDAVPHVVVLLDSIPYEAVARRHARGDWPWFPAPVKVIPPFPTMSGVIFTDILHAPPLSGIINRHYDRATGQTNNMIVARAFGAQNPWHTRLDYIAKYSENGLAFLQPREWFGVELARAKRAIDGSAKRVTLVYLASTSGMLSRFGEVGAEEVLDAIGPLCLQLLYERRGAVKISILADHGHNYLPGRRVDVAEMVRRAGLRPAERLKEADDVVIEEDGLVNYVGFHTKRAAELARSLVNEPEVQIAAHMSGEEVVVRSGAGAAAVHARSGRYRYRVIDADVLGLGAVVETLRGNGKVDAEGYIHGDDWLRATADHQYPDAPPRLWRAFHELVVSTPDVMVALADGCCIGLPMLQAFITMQSTHGGIDQVNSATFVMSMTRRAKGPMRSRDVMPTIEPGFGR